MEHVVFGCVQFGSFQGLTLSKPLYCPGVGGDCCQAREPQVRAGPTGCTGHTVAQAGAGQLEGHTQECSDQGAWVKGVIGALATSEEEPYCGFA